MAKMRIRLARKIIKEIQNNFFSEKYNEEQRSKALNRLKLQIGGVYCHMTFTPTHSSKMVVGYD